MKAQWSKAGESWLDSPALGPCGRPILSEARSISVKTYQVFQRKAERCTSQFVATLVARVCERHAAGPFLPCAQFQNELGDGYSDRSMDREGLLRGSFRFPTKSPHARHNNWYKISTTRVGRFA